MTWEYLDIDGKWKRCIDLHYDPVTDMDLWLKCEDVGETAEHRQINIV